MKKLSLGRFMSSAAEGRGCQTGEIVDSPKPLDYLSFMKSVRSLVTLGVLIVLASCTTAPKGDFFQSGVASWYGKRFHGRKTASGEKYDMYALTAAHKTLPFGTMVRVVEKNSGKSVKVRINDRGPFVKGRIIDLSFKAAKIMGFVDRGHADVLVYLIN